MIKNSKEKYGHVAIGLHWLVALITLSLFGVGLYMSDMDASPDKIKLYGLHKSFGVTLLFLVTLRLAWRLSNVQPDFVTNMKAIEKKLAKLAYFSFYVLLFAMPMSGWLMSSAGGRAVSFFGLFTLPDLIDKDKDLHEFFGEFHEIAAWVLVSLVALHAAAAFKHHFIAKDGTLRKMLPVLALFLLTALPARAEPPAWAVLGDQSTIGFSGKQMGTAFDGTFKKFTAAIAFDPDQLDQSHVNVVIDTASIASQDAERDNNLRESDWFDLTRFPQATFTSNSFRKLSEGQFEVTGTLTIRDKTLPVTFPFSLALSKIKDGKESADMKASLVLKRLDFDLGLGEWKDVTIIENETVISLHLVAERALAP